MLIAICIIAYILIGCILGVLCEYYDWECDSLLFGVLWPVLGLILLLYYLGSKFCGKINDLVFYFDQEGFHYCKEDISPCCGQCKYMRYYNYHNELNHCDICVGTKMSSEAIPCSQFKKHWLWRFRIRYKWDK